MINHQKRYDNWASEYDKDVAARDYVGPKFIIDYLMELIDQDKISILPSSVNVKVLDVACGSGLVGRLLKDQGFQHIDGTDISQGMIVQAHKSGTYKTLIPWQDLNYSLPFFLHGQYDLTVCCGVFALDFVKPQSLKWLMQVTKPSGIIIMSTKTTYYDNYDFAGYYQRLIQAGELKLTDCRMDKPYLGKEADGHYWIFSMPKSNEKNKQ